MFWKRTISSESSKGFINSILHGDSTSSASDAVVKIAHSKLLARGKFVHELSSNLLNLSCPVHNVKPNSMSEYLELIGEQYTRISLDPSFNLRLVGSWTTEVGELDQAVHIWEYTGYPGYTATTALLAKDVEFQKSLKKIAPMLRSRENQILLEFSFLETAQQIKDSEGIYELRSYTLKPGQLLSWEAEWKKGIEARKGVIQPIGAWFSQLGTLNNVHHMWKYPDLQTRKEMREKAWEQNQWSSAVSKTVRLIDSMKARILRPTSFSPFNYPSCEAMKELPKPFH